MMRKTIKVQPAITLLLLLGLSLQAWQTAAAQRPGPTPTPGDSLTGGEAILAQAINLLASGTPEAAEAALEKCEQARKIFFEAGDTKNEARTLFLMGVVNGSLGNNAPQ